MKTVCAYFLIAAVAALGVFALTRARSPETARRLSTDRVPMAADTASDADLHMTAYDARLRAVSEIDPAWIHYQEQTPPLEPQLEVLSAIAVGPDNRIYAAGGTHVVVLSDTGAHLERRAFDAPIRALTLGPEGRLYLGFDQAVAAFDPEGRRVADFAGISPDAILTALVAFEDTVFVADARRRAVLRYTPEGQPTGVIDGRRGDPNATGFVIPSLGFGLAPGTGRTLWVVNPGRHRLEKYNFDGDRLLAWDSRPGVELEAFCGCCNPCHIARLGDGSLVTSEKGIPRIKIYSRRGQFAGVVAAPERFDNPALPLPLAVDANDRILVADPSRKQIRIFVRHDGGGAG